MCVCCAVGLEKDIDIASQKRRFQAWLQFCSFFYFGDKRPNFCLNEKIRQARSNGVKMSFLRPKLTDARVGQIQKHVMSRNLSLPSSEMYRYRTESSFWGRECESPLTRPTHPQGKKEEEERGKKSHRKGVK